MLRLYHLMIVWMIMSAGCSGHFLPRPPALAKIDTERFVMVTAGPQDTLASLARHHLGSENKAWQIAAYNRVDRLAPGQKVVIPRIPLTSGGIQANGYQTVPVLLYTGISFQPTTSKAIRAEDFDLQLQYLDDNGFVTISLDQFSDFLSLRGQLPPNSVIISIDSTQSWVYDIAYPRLKNRGMQGVLLIRWKQVGTKGRLTWLQLAEMATHGFDIGLWGETIPPLSAKDLTQYFDAFEKKFTEPQKAFTTHLNLPCQYYAFPAGVSDDLTIAMLKKHGYRLAFTREQGTTPFFADNFTIKRSLVSGQFDPARFRQSLTTFKAAELK
jgi:peptidoglycan/xylan/chitin deacetylase (PgdA/CDA1 family)